MSELRTGNGRLSFRSGPPTRPGARVEAGVGMIDVSVTNNVTYLGTYISTTAARSMAEALLLAADIVDAQTETEDENETDKTIRAAVTALEPGSDLTGPAVANAVRALLAEQLSTGATTAAADLAAAILNRTTTEKSF